MFILIVLVMIKNDILQNSLIFVIVFIVTWLLQLFFQPNVNVSIHAVIKNYLIVNIFIRRNIVSVLLFLLYFVVTEILDLCMGITVDNPKEKTERCYESTSQIITKLPKDMQQEIVNFSGGLYLNEGEDPQTMLDNKIKWIVKNCDIKQGTKILDIGCGTGYVIQRLQKEYGADVYGIQLSQDAVDNNMYESLEGRVFVDNIKTIDRLDWYDNFDVLILNGSTEHFAYYKDYVVDNMTDIYNNIHDRMNKMLKPGGRIFYSGLYIIDEISNLSWEQYYYLYLVEREFGGWYPVKDRLKFMNSDYWKLKTVIDTTEGYYKYWAEFHDKLYMEPTEEMASACVSILSQQLLIDPYFIQAWILSQFPKNAFTEHLNPYKSWGSCRETFQVWVKP